MAASCVIARGKRWFEPGCKRLGNKKTKEGGAREWAAKKNDHTLSGVWISWT